MVDDQQCGVSKMGTAQLKMPIDGEIIVVSDVHLRSLDDSRGRLLLNLVRSIEGSCRVFVLNGDIFDFCLGSSNHFRRKYAELGAALADLAQRGTEVFFIPGNHEFWLQDLGWPGVKVQDRAHLTLSDGRKVLIQHGDRLNAPWHYHVYLAIVHARISHFFGSLLYGPWLDRLCLRFADLSRNRSRDRTLPHRRILAGALNWLTDSRADIGIFGHFHFPYFHRSQGNHVLLSVSSWDHPNALILEGSQFRRWTWDNSSGGRISTLGEADMISEVDSPQAMG